MLGKFMARAILDEALPPIFLEQAEDGSKLAKECLNLANGALKAPNFGPALAHVWGPGDMCSVRIFFILFYYYYYSSFMPFLSCFFFLNFLFSF